jgi:hypothetical protein
MLIPLINRVADEPDPTSRVKELIKALRIAIPSVTFEQDAFLTELDDKAAFIAICRWYSMGWRLEDEEQAMDGSEPMWRYRR